MTARSYSSPEAFKQGLEQRLRDKTASGAGLARKRQLLVFDRLLARIVQVFGTAVTLKGGLALELRLERARTTKDIDLRVMGTASELLPRLQEAGRLDLHDFMLFEVQPDREHPELTNDGLQYDGLRFRAECKLAGKLYGQPFGVDIVLGEPIAGEPDVVTADDVLSFAGIAPPQLQLYPIETHIAEKLHAYHSLRTGALPSVVHHAKENAEAAFIIKQVQTWLDAGRSPNSVCLVARTNDLLETRYIPLLRDAGFTVRQIKTSEASLGDGIRVATMHRVKGLEFPCVLIAAVQAGTVPLDRKSYADDTAKKDHIDTERRLLFVAATRARDELVVTGFGRASPLLNS